MKKKIFIFCILFLFAINLITVQATDLIVKPTKTELIKAVMLKFLTNGIDNLKTGAEIAGTLSGVNHLDANYPAFSNYVKGTDTFNNFTGGVEGALKWNEEAKNYYKSVGHDFAYGFIQREGTVDNPSFTADGVNIPNSISDLSMVAPSISPYYLYYNFYIDGKLIISTGLPSAGGVLYRVVTSVDYKNDISYNVYQVNGPNSSPPFSYVRRGVLGGYAFNRKYSFSLTVAPVVIESAYVASGTNNYLNNIAITNITIINNNINNNNDKIDKYIVPNFDNVKTLDDVEKLPLKDIYKTFDKKEDVKHYLDTAQPTEPTEPTEPEPTGLFDNLFKWFSIDWDIVSKSLDFTPIWKKHFKPFYDITDALTNIKVNPQNSGGKFYMVIPKAMGGDGITLICVLDYTVGGIYITWARTFIGWGIWLAFAWWILEQFKPKININ